MYYFRSGFRVTLSSATICCFVDFFSFSFYFSLFARFFFSCRGGERCFSMLAAFVLRSWLVSWQFDPIEERKIHHSVYSQTKDCQAREM